MNAYLPNNTWGAGVFSCPNYKWKVYDGQFAYKPALLALGSYAYNSMGADPTLGPTGWIRAGLGRPAWLGYNSLSVPCATLT
jgi:hypothetical protein